MNFPSVLPNPSQSYSSDVDPILQVTQFETNFRQRPKYGKTEERVKVSWVFTQLQFDIFKKFVNYYLIQGSQSFNVDIIGLDGLRSCLVQIVGGKFSSQYAGYMNYSVSCMLSVLETPQMSPELFEILTGEVMGDPSLFVLSSNILETHFGTA